MENNASLAAMVKRHIFRTLDSCGGNRTHAAKILGISLRGLRHKLRQYSNDGAGMASTQQLKAESRPNL